MKAIYRKYLNQTINPLFFIITCIILLAFTIGAHLAIRQIGVEADKCAAVLTASSTIR